jgi:hypothetical protein
MTRPRLSFESFLAHVFSPKKNAQPTGLRRTSLKWVKGRRKARVSAFNRMNSVKQNILTYAGQREAYLRGDVTFTDAKRSLRNDAVQRGVVKPLRRRYGQGENREDALKRRIADLLWRSTRQQVPTPYQRMKGLSPTSKQRIEDNVMRYLDQPEDEMLTWDFGTFQEAAKGYEVNGKRYLVFEGSAEHNPFWYH